MKGTIATLMGTLMVGATLALPAASFAQAPSVRLKEQRAGNFPVVHEAIAQLERTKQLLEGSAANDFHGHKVNAEKNIDAAIHELRVGIQEDRAHH